ncbi:MAG: hypothetical protein MJZ15_00865 [Bacteroidales bacterium]|nr:hypothetical protein [Bacteroidales bacterium]
MQYNIIDFANDYGEVIIERCNWRCVTRSLVIILIGAMLIGLPFVTDMDSDVLMMSCLVFGPILIMLGIGFAIFNSSELRYMSTNSPVRIHSSYMSPTSLDAVEKSLRTANIALGTNAKLEGCGQLRIDTLTSDDQKFCLCMVFQYVPYSYKPLYGPFVIDAELGRRLAKCRI